MHKTLAFAAFALLISGCLTEVVAPDVARQSSDNNLAPASDSSPAPSSDSNPAPSSGETTYGSITLSWTAPTYNTDGSVLTDLDGYRIYWGTAPGQYRNSVTIDNESITVYVLENIPVGTYEFVATSFNSAGVESNYSNPVTKVVM
jgi:hypothetical protein